MGVGIRVRVMGRGHVARVTSVDALSTTRACCI